MWWPIIICIIIIIIYIYISLEHRQSCTEDIRGQHQHVFCQQAPFLQTLRMETIDFTLQQSRRRSHDLMLGQQVSSQNAFEASKRRKLKMYNSNNHNRQRLKRRSNALAMQDENGSTLLLPGRKYCHNVEPK